MLDSSPQESAANKTYRFLVCDFSTLNSASKNCTKHSGPFDKEYHQYLEVAVQESKENTQGCLSSKFVYIHDLKDRLDTLGQQAPKANLTFNYLRSDGENCEYSLMVNQESGLNSNGIEIYFNLDLKMTQFSTQSHVADTEKIFIKDYAAESEKSDSRVIPGEYKGKKMWILWVILGGVIVGFILLAFLFEKVLSSQKRKDVYGLKDSLLNPSFHYGAGQKQSNIPSRIITLEGTDGLENTPKEDGASREIIPELMAEYKSSDYSGSNQAPGNSN